MKWIVNEQELIERAKLGNRSAMNTLLSENLTALKGYVIKMTGNQQLSQDIIQDTMVKAVLNIKKFEPRVKFSTWLIKISINVCRDYMRKNKIYESLDETIEDRGRDVEAAVISNCERKEIIDILLKLSIEKRTVFILKHFYGYKYEEIAEMINCPVGTVRSRLHNSVKFVITELERKGIV